MSNYLSVFLMLFCPQFFEVLVPFLEHLVVERQSSVKLVLSTLIQRLVYVGCGERGNEMADSPLFIQTPLMKLFGCMMMLAPSLKNMKRRKSHLIYIVLFPVFIYNEVLRSCLFLGRESSCKRSVHGLKMRSCCLFGFHSLH
ncbi:uncharacterized protein LOC113353632 [Papaver somniferum]|uniref:uncharacterized protein LOC113353632 n=1 Tax=Papaver somniferum TaxID=3469 RepID=UPI000E701582|nr:uncharacterized protein LOC113353632 [Papaver somniferum]